MESNVTQDIVPNTVEQSETEVSTLTIRECYHDIIDDIQKKINQYPIHQIMDNGMYLAKYFVVCVLENKLEQNSDASHKMRNVAENLEDNIGEIYKIYVSLYNGKSEDEQERISHRRLNNMRRNGKPDTLVSCMLEQVNNCLGQCKEQLLDLSDPYMDTIVECEKKTQDIIKTIIDDPNHFIFDNFSSFYELVEKYKTDNDLEEAKE